MTHCPTCGSTERNPFAAEDDPNPCAPCARRRHRRRRPELRARMALAWEVMRIPGPELARAADRLLARKKT